MLRDPDHEDLVVGVNAVSSALTAGGYGDRLLCAVFAFRDGGTGPSTSSTTSSAARSTRSCRPAASSSATPRASCDCKAQVGAELPIEEDLSRWFPLWGIPI